MAEPSDTRGVDNNWVLASPEGFVVETLGPDRDPSTAANGAPADVPLLSHDTESHAAEEYHESAASSSPLGPQDAKPPKATISPATFHQTEAVPLGTTSDSAQLEIPPDEGLGAGRAEVKAPSLTSKAEQCLRSLVQSVPEGFSLGHVRSWGQTLAGRSEDASESSSEEDVEGLRKRQVRDIRPAAHMAEPNRDMQAETDTWLTLNRCIMAALALVGLGLLVVAGTGFDADDGVLGNLAARDVAGSEQPTPQTVAEIKDWIKEHVDDVTGDPQPLHAMNDVLDRLAKENQDIRRMQAELQAQKEELQVLLDKSEGEKVSVGSKQKSLLEENIRLKESLLQEETAHLSVKEELEAMREKLQGVDPTIFITENAQLKAERDVERLQIEGFLVQKETLVAEAQMLRQELDKQRTLLASIRQEMENLTNNGSSLEVGVDVLQLREILEGIGSKLKSELQRSETWEKNYVKDKEQRREKASYNKKGRNPLEDAEVFPNASVSPGSTSGGKLERPTQPFRSTASTLKESMRGIINSEKKDKWKEGSQDWKENKHKKHTHAEGEDQWPHKKHHHHHREGGNDPQEHKTPEFDGRKNEWKGIPKDGKWKDWRESAEPHHHANAEKKREDERRHERLGNVLPHHREHRGAFQEGNFPKEEDAQQNRPQWEKPAEAAKKEHRHHDHNKFWKKLSDHQYRIPEGCSGVADCARKDGMDLFSKELAPVDRLEFQQLLREYLELQELAKYLPELDTFMSSFFEGDVFMHDKMRFRDFVDDVEDYLEDIAAKEKGDDDAVDDFDKHVFRHYFGEAAVKRRFSKKSASKTKPVSDNEEMGTEPLHAGPKHVKTEQGMKERSSNRQHKLSNALNQETEITEQPTGQPNDSKPFSHDQHRQSNSEHKSQTNGRQTHSHDIDHKAIKNENFEDRQSEHWNDSNPLKHGKNDQERPSEHRPSDPKPIKNEKNFQKRQSDQGQSDHKQSHQKKDLHDVQFDDQHREPKASKNEKQSKELKSHHSPDVSHEKQSSKRHSDHGNDNSEHEPHSNEKHSHSHHDAKHEKHSYEKQPHGGHEGSEHEAHNNERRTHQGHDETHPNERWSHHDYHHSKHETHPNEQKSHSEHHSKRETHSKERQSHHDHHDSKHEKHSNVKQSHHGHDDSVHEKHRNEKWSHGGHDESKHEMHHSERLARRGHDGSEHETHHSERLSHHGHDGSGHRNYRNEKQSHHDHHNSKPDHAYNKKPSHHDHHDSKHVKNHKESWPHHSHQDSKHEYYPNEKRSHHDHRKPKHEKYPSQSQPYQGHEDAKPDKFYKERQFKQPYEEPKTLENKKNLKERESYHHHEDSKPFTDKKHTKEEHSYHHHHHNDFKTSHKEDNPNMGKHRHEHEEHGDYKSGKRHKEEGSTHQYHKDANSFHHKKQMEKDELDSHHHSGSKAFRDERPSHDHDGHKHDQNAGHHKGPRTDKAHKEDRK